MFHVNRLLNRLLNPVLHIVLYPSASANSSSAAASAADTTSSERLETNDILISIPKNINRKAKGILNHIKQNSKKIDWNGKGEVIINGEKIEGSHIIDLIKCTLLPYKKVHPKGFNAFRAVLQDSNIPQTLIIQSGQGLFPPPGIPGTIKTPDIAKKGKKHKWLWQKM